MTWIKIDDSFPNHPKVIGLSDKAFRVHISSLCYCGTYLTDGFIPMTVAAKFVEGEMAVLVELTTAGLWIEDVTNNGFTIHDYLAHQSSKTQVLAHKDANRARGERYRERKAEANAVSHALVTTPDTDTDTDTDKRISNPIHKELAEYLAKRIQDNGSKLPVVTESWIKEIRLMMERDGRTVEQIRYIIDWCQNDSFWRSNILSPNKLRAKFDQLRLNADKNSVRKVPQSETFLRDFLSESVTGVTGMTALEGYGR